MWGKLNYTYTGFQNDIEKLASKLEPYNYTKIFGVPRGGIPLAAALSQIMGVILLSAPEQGCLVVDDIIDSGKTREFYNEYDFATLHKRHTAQFVYAKNKPRHTFFINYLKDETWIIYPWEQSEEQSVSDNITRIFQYLNEDPNREGLIKTPDRVVKSWKEIYSGYNADPKEVFTHFDKGTYDQIVILKDIEMYSMCEHHMLPFIGRTHIAYIPTDKIIGVSKLARLLEIYARRLQIQERIGEQVTEAIMKNLNAQGAACIIKAKHLCMQMRGVSKQHSTMVTSSLKGVFMDKPEARAELMGLIK